MSEMDIQTLPLPRLAIAGPGSDCFTGENSSLSSGSKQSPKPGIAYLTDDSLFDATGTRLAFSFRTGGYSNPPFDTLNLGLNVNDDPAVVEANRQALMHAMGLGGEPDGVGGSDGIGKSDNPASCPAGRYVNPLQVHGDAIIEILPSMDSHSGGVSSGGISSGVVSVDGPESDGIIKVDAPSKPLVGIEADAVISCVPGVPALLCYADCVPVIIVAPSGQFAVVHSGWKGTIKRISAKAVSELAKLSGCKPSSMNSYIGPHIGACCYEVSADLAQRFAMEFGSECIRGERNLDLEYAVVAALESAGISPDRIASAGLCTAENTHKLFSHRAEHGKTGRFAAVCCKI